MSNQEKIGDGDGSRTWSVLGGLFFALVLLCLLAGLTGPKGTAGDVEDSSSGETVAIRALNEKIDRLLSRPVSSGATEEGLRRVEGALETLQKASFRSRDDQQNLLGAVAERIAHRGELDSVAVLASLEVLSKRLIAAEKRVAELQDSASQPVDQTKAILNERRLQQLSFRQKALEQALLPLARKLGVRRTVPRDGILVDRPLEELLIEVVQNLEDPSRALELAAAQARMDLLRVGQQAGIPRKELRGERLLSRIVQRLKTLVDIEYRQELQMDEFDKVRGRIRELEKLRSLDAKQVEYLERYVEELKSGGTGGEGTERSR